MSRIAPFIVQTCEGAAKGERPVPLLPQHGEDVALFSLEDPFGLRKAIIPLLWLAPSGDLEGLGTAFALDPWGRFATADHVISDLRRGRARRDGGAYQFDGPGDEGVVGILGHGLVFGTIGIPQHAIAPITRTWSPATPDNDPIAAMQGRATARPLDLAVLQTRRPPPQNIANLSIASRPRGPRVGDVVMAIGYPQVDTFSGRLEDVRTTIDEGMMAAYGRVTQLHPDGRDRANPTPVFEVEANWPSGMSGGPVFDSQGRVIGVVSRSLSSQQPGELGAGWATWLQAIPSFAEAAPSLLGDMPAWRRGWAVVQEEPWRIAAVEPDETHADVVRRRAGLSYVVREGAWWVGSDDFVSGA